MNASSPGRQILLTCGALLAIPVLGSFAHVSVTPARFYTSDWAMLIPLALCVGTGMRIRDGARRLVFGLAQAVLLISVYSNLWSREISFGDAYVVFGQWVVLAALYSVAFWGLTSRLRAQPE